MKNLMTGQLLVAALLLATGTLFAANEFGPGGSGGQGEDSTDGSGGGDSEPEECWPEWPLTVENQPEIIVVSLEGSSLYARVGYTNPVTQELVEDEHNVHIGPPSQIPAPADELGFSGANRISTSAHLTPSFCCASSGDEYILDTHVQMYAGLFELNHLNTALGYGPEYDGLTGLRFETWGQIESQPADTDDPGPGYPQNLLSAANGVVHFILAEPGFVEIDGVGWTDTGGHVKCRLVGEEQLSGEFFWSDAWYDAGASYWQGPYECWPAGHYRVEFEYATDSQQEALWSWEQGGFSGVLVATASDPDYPSPFAQNDICWGATDLGTLESSFFVQDNNQKALDSSATYFPVDDSLCSGTNLGGLNRDLWYTFLVPADVGSCSAITLSSCDSSFDTSMVVYEGDDCFNATPIACNGDATDPTGCRVDTSEIVLENLTPGARLYVRVGNYSSYDPWGNITLRVTYEQSLPPESCGSSVRRVPAEYATIQGAIDAASDGDVILVSPGVYTGSGQAVVDMGGKAIKLRALDLDAPLPVIDGQGQRRCVQCTSGEGSGSLIRGFRLVNGSTHGPNQHGGGALCIGSSPTFHSCVFAGNRSSSDGGGLYIDGGQPAILYCSFEDNEADNGGGMYARNSSPTLVGCTFEGNHASRIGGGVFSHANNLSLAECTICGNAPDQIRGSWINNEGNQVSDVCGSSRASDVNDDGKTDGEDLAYVLGVWGSDDALGDIDGDGIVSGADLTVLLGEWN